MSTGRSRTLGKKDERQKLVVALLTMLLLTMTRAGRARADITLILFDPTYSECGTVSINGVVLSDDPDEPVFGLMWDWGDGSVESSLFPASHQYSANDTYSVHVVATGCTTESESATVEVTNAEEPGCTPNPDWYSLSPFNFHLTAGSVSATPLEIRDNHGNPVSGSIVFFVSDPTLVSISPDGYVTALREEAAHEIGTWVEAAIDGVHVANACIVRVLSRDYAVPFVEAMGEHTALCYPATVNAEDISTLVATYEIETVNEYAYGIQDGLIDTGPFGGARQVFEVDFGEFESQRVCGLSGNPIRLGWNIAGNDWQNCFLVPFIPPRSPQWFVFYHELGHNVTWASSTFALGLGSVVYSEGLASVMSLETMHRVSNDGTRYPLGEPARDSIEFVYDERSQEYLQALDGWLAGGAEFSLLNPDIVDGLWLHYRSVRGDDLAARFFLPLQPRNIPKVAPVLCETIPLGDDGKHTFFAALVSAAVGRDLSGEFAETYHYPLNQGLFDSAYAVFAEIVNCPEDLDDSGAVDFGDILAVLSAWGHEGGPEDLDGNGVVAFGDILIVLASWGPCE